MSNITSEKAIRLTTLIVEWLNSHKLISVNGLEKELGLPRGAIALAKGSRNIPTEYIFPVMHYLSDYGLKIEDWQCSKIDERSFLAKKVLSTKHKKSGDGFVQVQEVAQTIISEYADITKALVF